MIGPGRPDSRGGRAAGCEKWRESAKFATLVSDAPMHAKPGAPSPSPTGTVTFLFTDIEGSTTLWEQHPAVMQAALARHDTALRQAIESSNGHVVKTTGDGRLPVFDAAADALGACLAAQRALHVEDMRAAASQLIVAARDAEPALRVRMALHTGVAEFRDNDYFGTALNRAARIMSAAHGEQILLSAATAELLRDQLPEGVTLRDMGEHRLKGLPNPQRLLQVVAPDLRADFPPLASLTGGHSLPAERDAFVGRRESLAELSRRLEAGARLLSVLGLGGTGKTRLATRFGWTALESFPGGVWFCDLSQARNVNGIVHAVAQGLGVPLSGDDPVTHLGQVIAGRGRCLVILDNFEQVARHAEETLGPWLNRASAAQFLVTTREVLGVAGEETLALAPLAAGDAAALFTRRAEAVKPELQSTPEDEAAIARLVKLLDGLPLAIELAAARVRVMPPRTLLLRMSERFKLLSSSGGRVDRQATLRAVFDWSWDLLSLPEKAALAQLSVFEGGFTLAAVEAILDLSPYDTAPLPMDALQSLVQKSLVRQVADERFDLLVSVQDYAIEHLRTTGRYAGSGPEARLAAETRHGAYYASCAEAPASVAVCADLDNFVAACRRAAARGDARIAADALQGAWAALSLRGPFKVGIELAAEVQAIPALAADAAAKVRWIAGRAFEAVGNDAEARKQFVESLALSRATGDRRCECRALVGLAECDSHAGRMDVARTQFEDALQIARELQDRTLQSVACSGLGTIAILLGRAGEAEAQFDEARKLARKAGDREREGRILANMGVLLINAGKMPEARSHDDAALAAAREVGNRQLEGNILCNLGQLDQVEGKLGDALEQLHAALPIARDLGDARMESIVLCNLGMVCDGLDRFDEARDNFEAALAIARESGDRHREGQFLTYLGLLHARQADFARARECLDAGEALLRSVQDRSSLGVELCSRAELEELAGNPGAVSAALAEAALIAAEVGAGPNSELGIALARVEKLRLDGRRDPLVP